MGSNGPKKLCFTLKLKVMKIKNLLFTCIVAFGMAVYISGCSDDDPKATFTLVSLSAGDIDLAGVTAATEVPEDADIIAVFSSTIDATTATNATMSITNADGDEVSYTVTVSDATVTLSPTTSWDQGTQFNIVLAATIAGENGAIYEGNSLSFRTSGIFIPSKENQVLYINFDNSTTVDDTETHTVTTVGTMQFAEDRRAGANSAAFFDGEGNLVEVAASSELIEGSKTISYWFKTETADYDGGAGTGVPQTRFLMGLGVEKGYFLELGRRSNDPASDGYAEFFLKYATNQVNVGNNSADVPEATAWTEINSQISVNFEDGVASGWSFALDELQEDPPNRVYVADQVMGKWTHLVMTVDASARTKTFYINGDKWGTFQWIGSGADWLFGELSLKTENNDGSAVEGIEGSLAIGFAGSSTNTATGWANHATTLTNDAENKKFFKGAVDQVRVFNVALNDADIKMLYDNEK